MPPTQSDKLNPSTASTSTADSKPGTTKGNDDPIDSTTITTSSEGLEGPMSDSTAPTTGFDSDNDDVIDVRDGHALDTLKGIVQ